jgi:hypothetical protein
MTPPFSLDPRVPYRELRDPPLPDSLRALALDCFAAQRAALDGRIVSPVPPVSAAPGPAREAVSERALAEILASGREIGGIVTRREIATAVPFNARAANDVVWSRAVAARRRRVDAALARWVGALFDGAAGPVLLRAGQWWYPPGTSFGWHTNHAYPGWRLYLSHAEEEGASFFRYRHPLSGAVVTSPDGLWDLRLFEVSAERPLWHAIYSDTHRFSLGWFVRPWSIGTAVAARVKQLADDARCRLRGDRSIPARPE